MTAAVVEADQHALGRTYRALDDARRRDQSACPLIGGLAAELIEHLRGHARARRAADARAASAADVLRRGRVQRVGDPGRLVLDDRVRGERLLELDLLRSAQLRCALGQARIRLRIHLRECRLVHARQVGQRNREPASPCDLVLDFADGELDDPRDQPLEDALFADVTQIVDERFAEPRLPHHEDRIAAGLFVDPLQTIRDVHPRRSIHEPAMKVHDKPSARIHAVDQRSEVRTGRLVETTIAQTHDVGHGDVNLNDQGSRRPGARAGHSARVTGRDSRS